MFEVALVVDSSGCFPLACLPQEGLRPLENHKDRRTNGRTVISNYLSDRQAEGEEVGKVGLRLASIHILSKVMVHRHSLVTYIHAVFLLSFIEPSTSNETQISLMASTQILISVDLSYSGGYSTASRVGSLFAPLPPPTPTPVPGIPHPKSKKVTENIKLI